MKKLIALLIVTLLILSLCFSLSGCDQPTVHVRSELMISDGFSGTRTVTAVYPLSADIDAVKDLLIADSPTLEIDGADFTYVGVEEDGYHFQLLLHFGNKTQYEKIIAALIGRSTNVFLSRKNTFLTRGTRMNEDFDVSELVPWVISDTASSDALKNLKFAFDTNTVRIGSDTFDTASTISINDCTGSPINSISLKTTNDKADTYTRTFAFSIPNDTYTADKNAIEQYFLTNTLSDARYAGWSQEGSNMVYTVIYEQLDLEKMTDVTSRLLDTDSVSITYGDLDNASTPLSEGLTFEENLDTFSFIGPDNGFTPLYYSYSLPLNTTYGDGSVFENGRWVSAGEWKDDLYNVTLDSGSARLRIPDGIQYSIKGIEFSIASIDLEVPVFRRTTDFLYAKEDRNAAEYAKSYFDSKNVESAIHETDDSLICFVVFEGTTEEITSQLVSVFGSGNFIAYEQKKGTFDLSIKTELTDYVNLGYMLNADNAAVPMNYTVSSEGGENIVSVSVDGSETAYTDHSRGTLPVQNGCAVIQYHGNIPVIRSIIIYLASGAVLLLLTAFIAIKLIKPKKKRRYADPLNNPDEVYETEADVIEEESVSEETPQPASRDPLAQTTTFSIFELNTLVRNKKYVDEINKDVGARMHAQSLEEQKQDIRARELEEMSRKVYGAGEADESEPPEEAESSETEADSAALSASPENTEMPNSEEISDD